jgi:D-amino-acid dehydrogenase
MEPALSPTIRHAVFTPQWSHINDPKVLVDRLRQSVQADGVMIRTGAVMGILPPDGSGAGIELEDGRQLKADKVIVAAGAWSGLLARQLGDRVLIESERGYNMTLAEPGIHLDREVIFAERKFVATPLSCGLRIGGAAEFGGLDAAANYKRSAALVTLARRYLPGLKIDGGTPWAGHRPTTPDSLPVIGPSASHPDVVYAFGHGHLGLTQAATTGRLVADLIFQKPASLDLSPYSITRFR